MDKHKFCVIQNFETEEFIQYISVEEAMPLKQDKGKGGLKLGWRF